MVTKVTSEIGETQPSGVKVCTRCPSWIVNTLTVPSCKEHEIKTISFVQTINITNK